MESAVSTHQSDSTNPSHDEQRSSCLKTKGGIPLILTTDQDYLVGPGQAKNTHPGNMKLNALTRKVARMYNGTASRNTKNRITRMVYEDFTKDGGLFLRKSTSPQDDFWIPLDQGEAQMKIAMNIRYKKRKFLEIASFRRHLAKIKSKKAAKNDDESGTKSTRTEGTRGSPNSAEAALSDTSDSLLASTPSPIDQSRPEAAHGQHHRTVPRSAFCELLEVTKNEYEEDESIIIEKASVTGVDWSMSSATLSNPEEAWPRLVRFMVAVLELVAEPPSENFARRCLRMRGIDKAYVKTVRIPRDHGLDGTILGALVDLFYNNGLAPYFQFYSGMWLLPWLTTVHQDGGTIHGDVYRVFIRIFGHTGFFSSRNEQNLFYTADCHKTIRATLATHKAFSGVTKEGRNNGVFHAGGKDEMALPSMAIMADKEDYSMLKETDHIKSLQLVMRIIDQLPPSSNLQQDLERLRYFGEKIFGDGGTIHDMKTYFGSGFTGYLPESLEAQWKDPIPFTFSIEKDIDEDDEIYVPIIAPGTNYNPNTDVVITNGGAPSFRKKIENTRGNTIYRCLLLETALNWMQIGQYGNRNEIRNKKTELRVKLVHNFHECTNGGRFFRISGDGIITQLSAEQLLRGKNKSLMTQQISYQITKTKEAQKKEKPAEKRAASGQFIKKLCRTTTTPTTMIDNSNSQRCSSSMIEDILPPEPVDIDYGKPPQLYSKAAQYPKVPRTSL